MKIEVPAYILLIIFLALLIIITLYVDMMNATIEELQVIVSDTLDLQFEHIQSTEQNTRLINDLWDQVNGSPP